MHISIIDIKVKPDYIDAFIEASLKNHYGSIAEEGNVRFDILQHPEEKGRFTFYEIFKDEEATKAHKQTEHYLTWREDVADFMAEPRQGKTWDVIAPN